jgi:NAD(P)-dependent dehydrogenase (short-subunit alcohol dehydrogenase family)
MPQPATPRKIALVTGGNKGIGFAIAHGLAALDMHVLIGCRSVERGEAAADRLREGGGQVDVLEVDVTDDASIAAAQMAVDVQFGRLDVLVNNAGVSLDAQIGARSLRSVMAATFDVNVFSVAAMIEAFAPLLARSDAPRIVNLSSGLGSLTQNSDPTYAFAGAKPTAYNASKAAVNMLTVLYAAKLGDRGIKINAADPGFTATDLNDHRGTRTPEQGAIAAIRLATLDAGGPTGGFFDESGVVPW